MHPTRSCFVSLVGALALASPALASGLSLDGQSFLAKAYGQPVAIELHAGANKLAYIFYDLSPGPVSVAGEWVPLGLTPLLTPIAGGNTGPSGTLATTLFLPEDPVLAGLNLFFAGVALDAADPNGLDLSNGAVLAIQPPCSAGADQSGFVGRSAILDGSGTLLSATSPPPGMSFQWTLVQKPGGSTAGIGSASSAFATLVPDFPGEYRARLRVTLGGVQQFDECVLHAYRLTTVPPLDGSFTPSVLGGFSGTLEGPAPATLKFNGAPLALSGTSFGPTSFFYDFDKTLQTLEFELGAPDGTSARTIATVGLGSAAPLSAASPNSLLVDLEGAGLDALEPAGLSELQGADIAGVLLAQPPVLLADDEGPFGFTFFSATVDFHSLNYNAAGMALDLWPAVDGLHGRVTIPNVHATFGVSGVLLEIPYSLNGSMGSNPVEIQATIKFTVSGGQLVATVSNVAVTRYAFSFDLDGFLGDVAQLFVIEEGVKADVEAAIASAVQSELGPALQALLSSYQLAGNLYSTLQVDVQLAAPFAGVTHTSHGITLRLNGKASALSAEPGSPAITHCLSTPSSAPSFGASTPTGQAYGAGLAVADDFLNQVLAASTAAGLLNGDLSSLLAASGALDFTTDGLAPLFPGAGFEAFPSGTPVQLQASGHFAPVVRTTPGQPALARLELAGLEVAFRVAGAQGPLPLLTLSLAGSAGLNLSIGLDGTLSATLSNLALLAHVLEARAGADPQVLQQGLDFLTQLLAPQLAELIGALPLPSLAAQGLGLLPSQVLLVGSGSEYAAFYGQLVLTP